MLATVISRSVDSLNALLRASLAAEECYARGIASLEKAAHRGAIALRALLASHERNITILRREILGLGGEPEVSSGLWGAWARANESFAALFGNASALEALQEAEEHGLRTARSALTALEEPERSLVEERVIPSLEGHIRLLEAMRTPL